MFIIKITYYDKDFFVNNFLKALTKAAIKTNVLNKQTIAGPLETLYSYDI